VTNLATFGDCEAGVTGWATAAGASGVASGAQSASAAHSGSNGYRGTWTTASTFQAALEYNITAGIVQYQPYWVQAWVRPSQARNFQMQVLYRNAAQSVIETDTGPLFAVAANAWQQLVLFTFCATTAVTRLTLQLLLPDAAFPLGATIDGDDLAFTLAAKPPQFPSLAVHRASLI
jgi:hypothetical protein